MTPAQYRTRTTIRLLTLTALVGVWLFLAHAIPAAAVAVFGL